MQDKRVDTFRSLHKSGCFMMPNPWSVGTAVALEAIGFPAIATTSSGLAWTIARSDNSISLEAALEHFRSVASAVRIPVNADFEGGFAVDPEGVRVNVAFAVNTGIAGLSIEDSSGNHDKPLYDFELAVERVRAAREALDASGRRVVLTGRSEGFVAGRPDIDETIRRLVGYAEAGADCLYAPGASKTEYITAIIEAVAPKPINVLVSTNYTSVETLAALGVRRISTGGALARVAWTAFLAAAREIEKDGTFGGLDPIASTASLDEWFAR